MFPTLTDAESGATIPAMKSSLKAILAGLAVSHAVSTAMVGLSNAELARTVEIVSEAGWLSVPNRNLIPALNSFESAFYGGFFFTFTVGAFLTLAGLACALFWKSVLKRNAGSLLFFLPFPALCVLCVNIVEFNYLATLFFLAVPAVTFLVACTGGAPDEKVENFWHSAAPHIAAFVMPAIILILLAFVWNMKIDQKIFSKLRDDYLISNSVGRKVHDFYYAYTLYPAGVFKSLWQKSIRTCEFAGDSSTISRRVKRTLSNYNWLPVSGGPVDLDVRIESKMLVMRNDGETVLEVEPAKFLKNPGKFLKKFSQKTDGRLFFRRFTYFSLLTVCSVTLYSFIYLAFRIPFGLFLKPKHALTVACVLTVVAETVFLYPLYVQTEKPADARTALSKLESDDWRDRTEALKTLYRLKKPPGKFRNREKMMKSPRIPERYWMAKTVGISRGPGIYKDIVFFLDDDYFSVVYNSYEALGRLKDRRGIAEIEKRFDKLNNWYVQVYAYKALRRLGWRQKGPKSK